MYQQYFLLIELAGICSFVIAATPDENPIDQILKKHDPRLIPLQDQWKSNPDPVRVSVSPSLNRILDFVRAKFFLIISNCIRR